MLGSHKSHNGCDRGLYCSRFSKRVGAECRNPCLGGFLRATILEGAALDARNALRGWRSDSPAELVAMELPEDAILLRIFIGESDRHRNRPLYEINGFLPVLDEMMNGGLVTLESAKVIHYGPEKKRRDHT
jgi:hypothetical protein